MKPLIVANWKCNPTTLQEAKRLFNSVKEEMRNLKNSEVVICPPFVYLINLQLTRPTSPASELAGGRATYNLQLGAQDCFWEGKGAFTGEISPLMLKNLGCEYVIVGHSERRKLGETDEMINKKIKAALKVKLKPILCIGETLEEKNTGLTRVKLNSQIKKGLQKISKKEIQDIIIAYEPLWAIGTGNPCEPKEAKKVYLFLRKILAPYQACFGAGLKKIPILYGGSVNSENATSYIHEANFQGLLVGGASLKAEEFIKMVRIVSNY